MRLVLFFTFGLSLRKWKEIGILDREIAIYNELQRNGTQVVLFTYGDSGDLEFKERLGSIEVFPAYSYIGKPKSGFLRFLQSIILPIKFKNLFASADIYKTNQMWGSWVAVIAKLLYRKRLVVRCGYEQFRFSQLMNRGIVYRGFIYLNSLISYWLADVIIISSERAKKMVKRYFRVPGRRIHVLHNYIDTDLFRPMASEKYPDRLIFVGRLEEQKNLFNLLQAVKQTSYSLDIIGDGTLKRKIVSYIKENDIRANILGLVKNNEMPGLLNKYPVYVIPSFWEGNPKTLLEAMSCGLAVIGSDAEGISDCISNGKNGLLCGTEVDSIRDVILRLMPDKGLRQSLGSGARETVVENNNLKNISLRELKLYEGFMSGWKN